MQVDRLHDLVSFLSGQLRQIQGQVQQIQGQLVDTQNKLFATETDLAHKLRFERGSVLDL